MLRNAILVTLRISTRLSCLSQFCLLSIYFIIHFSIIRSRTTPKIDRSIRESQLTRASQQHCQAHAGTYRLFCFAIKVKNEPRIFRVSKEHIKIVVGKDHKNIENIEKKSKTKIGVPSAQHTEGTVCKEVSQIYACPLLSV